MGYSHKILSLVVLFSIITMVPFSHYIVTGNVDEDINNRSNSNLIYYPLISNPKVVSINSNFEMCNKNFEFEGVVGKVENHSSSTIYKVILNLTLYNHETKVNDSFEITPEFSATFPNNINPFSWGLGSLPQPYRGQYGMCPNAKLDIKSWSFDSSTEYRPLSILSAYLEKRTINWYTTSWLVSGDIRNDQENDLQDIKIVVIPECGSYKLASVEDEVLSPGEETGYFISWKIYDYYGGELPPYCDYVDVFGQGHLVP